MQRCSPQVHPTRTLGMRAISATVLLSKSVTLFQAFLSKICEESSPAASRDVEPMSKCAAAAVDLRASYRSTAFRPVLVTTAAGQPVRLVSNCQFRPRDRHRWRARGAAPLCAERGGASAFGVRAGAGLRCPSSDPSQGGWSCPIGSIFVPGCPLHFPASALRRPRTRADFPLQLLSSNGGGRCD